MTNEEKIENIISKYETKYNDTSDLLWTDIEDVAMEMAEWKDEQFNMIIEKIIDLFDKYPSNVVFSKNNVIEMFKTFKKAMEE